MNEDYEMFPQKLIEDLKYDVEALKKKLSEPETATQELLAEIADLKSNIKDLHSLFQQALQDIKEEDSAKLLASLQNKIEAVTTQNETIARGMVAISDKLEDFMKKHSAPQPKLPPHSAIPHPPPSPPGVPPSPFPPPSRIAPHPLKSPPPRPPPGLPPLPSGEHPPGPPPGVPLPPPEVKAKKKGLFKL